MSANQRPAEKPTLPDSAYASPLGPAVPTPFRDFLNQLQADFPDLRFRPGPRFSFRPPKTLQIAYDPTYPPTKNALLTLHELGHALSKHKDYKVDVERLKLESEAWERAKTLLSEHPNYSKILPGLVYYPDFAEDQLDSYRDWLHARSLCKACGLTRYQTPDGRYHCPLCDPS